MKKKLIKIIAGSMVCLSLFAMPMILTGCGEKEKPKELQTSATIGNIKYGIDSVLVIDEEYSNNNVKVLSYYVICDFIISIQNLGGETFSFAKNAIKIVSGKDKFVFDWGKYPETTTLITTDNDGIDVGPNVLRTLRFEDVKIKYKNVSGSNIKDVLKCRNEFESTIFSVYTGVDLIGQFKCNVV